MTLKTKQGCQTPGCDWPNWHLCTKANTSDRFPELLGMRPIQQQPQSSAARRERDDRVVEMYNTGRVSMKDIASEFAIGYDTVRQILKDAEEQGLTTLRKRGETLRWDGK